MKGRPVSFLAGISLALVCGGAAVAVAQEEGIPRAPSGLTLLASDDTSCNGALMLAPGGERGGRDMRLEREESALLEVDDPNIGWQCEGDRSSHGDTMECPNETTHVRVLRAPARDLVLFECFG